MFRSFARTFLPNPLDYKLKRCAKKGGKKILLEWNRGLGDLALGLFAIIQRIREIIPNAEITFLTRENLREGFSLLEKIQILIDPSWKRGEPTNVRNSLKRLEIDPESFDLIIEKPSPTDWVRWQRGKVIPRLKWSPSYEHAWQKFDLPDGFLYIGVQIVAETNYGLWRNWPLKRWQELLEKLKRFDNVRVLLFGFGDELQFSLQNTIDLRGKTTLIELLSIIKNRCQYLILPDSGILSMTYYLDKSFPIELISLWADPNHGILKQAVSSPNPQLVHHPLIGKNRDLSSVSVNDVLQKIFHVKPLYKCTFYKDAPVETLKNTGCILLAGGQGSRLGFKEPKGTFQVLEKSLFQWICEKAPEKNFPIAVMTSPLNHQETVSFFHKNRNFNREIYFFQQDLLPFMKNEKKALKIKGKALHAPDGNGGVYKAFIRSGLGEVFQKKGIDLITIIPVENALANPADRHLIGYARKTHSDVIVKCVKREKPDESMGVLVERKGKIEIIEYSDLDPGFSYPFSYAGMMAISLPFFLHMAKIELPLHWVKKKPPGWKTYAWKREKFLFDVLPYAEHVSALCYPRESCYAPIKNFHSLQNVERILGIKP